MVSDPYEYDVAVSFAGAQRAYVEKFVEACRQRGLTVFYDRDMTVAYWGRNFIQEFRRVYGGSAARFVMPFISAEYLAAPYPQDELAAAVEQVLRREGPYLLPVVVGDVVIPPELLSPATGWLRADDHTPAQLAEMTAQRLAVAEADASGSRPAAGLPTGATRQEGARHLGLTPAALVAASVAAVTGLVWWILDYESGNPGGDWRFVPIALTIAGVCGAAALILRGSVGKLVALVAAAVGVVLAIGGLVPSGAPDSVPASAPGSVPRSVPSSAPGSSSDSACTRLATTAVVSPGPDSGAVDARLLEATYVAGAPPHGRISFQLAGKIRGAPRPNQVLWILGTADPRTHDSNRPPSYGSTQYHVVQQITPGTAGCWITTRRSFGYDCLGGVTFNYYLAALDPQEAQQMQRLEQGGQDGFSLREIQDRHIPLLSTFDVPTKPNC